MSVQAHLSGLPSVSGASAGAFDRIDALIESALPDMLVKLSVKEKKIWRHVTEALLEYGLIHRTDGILLTVISKTFVSWVDAEEELEKYKRDNNGSYITESANGYRAPHPLYYVARDHKKDLLRWLPEACLTIPTFQRAKAADLAAGAQGSLFDDPVAAFKAQKTEIGLRRVK